MAPTATAVPSHPARGRESASLLRSGVLSLIQGEEGSRRALATATEWLRALQVGAEPNGHGDDLKRFEVTSGENDATPRVAAVSISIMGKVCQHSAQKTLTEATPGILGAVTGE